MMPWPISTVGSLYDLLDDRQSRTQTSKSKVAERLSQKLSGERKGEREEEARRRAIQRQLALSYEPSQAAGVPVAQSSTTSFVAIIDARSTKFTRDITRYSPFRLAQLYLTFIACLMTRNTPMPRSLSIVKIYLFINPLSARKANTSKRHFRARSLGEVQGCSPSIMIVQPPIGEC
ncbi:hypothetical protein IG631_23748 [Alternaria alternata]|nr:hypothetical protein IG631_23748 [Alternaria alternata]